jgi:thymidylate kinase
VASYAIKTRRRIGMIIVVDGNDGTGKSTLVNKLIKKGYEVKDRGIPTKLTDNPSLKPNSNEFYVILDAPVEVCSERLKQAGRDMTEKYHTLEGLTHYRQRFLDVAKQLQGYCIVIDASKNPDEILNNTLKYLKEKLKND